MLCPAASCELARRMSSTRHPDRSGAELGRQRRPPLQLLSKLSRCAEKAVRRRQTGTLLRLSVRPFGVRCRYHTEPVLFCTTVGYEARYSVHQRYATGTVDTKKPTVSRCLCLPVPASRDWSDEGYTTLPYIIFSVVLV